MCINMIDVIQFLHFIRYMKENIKLINSIEPVYYEKFINPNNQIKIDVSRIDLSLLCGEERKVLKTPITGDSSLILKYQEKEGAVMSMNTFDEEFSILQLQGAKNKVSYKVSTGIDWINLFSNQVSEIVSSNQEYFKLISMPSLNRIEGLYDTGTEMAAKRYVRFANILGMRFSRENDKYIKEVFKKI